MDEYFQNDVRVDDTVLKTLSLAQLIEIASQYSSPKVNRAVKYLKKLQDHE